MWARGSEIHQHTCLCIPELLPLCKEIAIGPDVLHFIRDWHWPASSGQECMNISCKRMFWIPLWQVSRTASVGVFFWRWADFIGSVCCLFAPTGNIVSFACSRLFSSVIVLHVVLRVTASHRSSEEAVWVNTHTFDVNACRSTRCLCQLPSETSPQYSIGVNTSTRTKVCKTFAFALWNVPASFWIKEVREVIFFFKCSR